MSTPSEILIYQRNSQGDFTEKTFVGANQFIYTNESGSLVSSPNIVVSGSIEINGQNLEQIILSTTGAIDTLSQSLVSGASIPKQALTSSYLLSSNQDITFHQITASAAVFNGNVDILGELKVREMTIISSSVLYESGSTVFGNSQDDTHEFTGSILITGSININGQDLVQVILSTTGAIDILSQSLASGANKPKQSATSSYLLSSNQDISFNHITSSTIYSSGSNTFGSNSGSVQQVTGSVQISGSLFLNNMDLSGATKTFTSSSNGLVPSASTAIGRTLKDTGWDAPDLGARPYLPSADKSFLSANDGSFIYLKGGVAYIGDGLGNTTTISLGINVSLDTVENPIDVETTINGQKYSLINGNSDSMGLPDAGGTAYPIVQGLNNPNIGAIASPRIIQGRTL